MTIEAIKRDPWNAVVLDLPTNGTAELYATAANAAQRLLNTLDGELPPMPFPVPKDERNGSTLARK